AVPGQPLRASGWWLALVCYAAGAGARPCGSVPEPGIVQIATLIRAVRPRGSPEEHEFGRERGAVERHARAVAGTGMVGRNEYSPSPLVPYPRVLQRPSSLVGAPEHDDLSPDAVVGIKGEGHAAPG